MKTYTNLWEVFETKENFDIACYNSQKNGKKNKQKEIRKFNENKEDNLEKVRQMVINGEFHTSPYREKTIHEPKERIIYILPYSPDRIVQHAVMNVLKPIFKNLIIENSYACVEGKGQIKASLKCSEYVRKYNYCLKCDIKKFYPSVNQKILSDMLHRIIKDDRFMAVVDDIIFSYQSEDNPFHNIPIGNFTSQWFGNYYLTKMDNFILHELKCGSYERYCDDFMLFSNDKKYLHECRVRILEYIKSELDLVFSKADVFSVKQGVDFCGYRHFKKYKLLRKKTAKRLKSRFKKIRKELNSDNYNIEKIQGQLASGNGILKHACTYNLRNSLDYSNLVHLMKKKGA